MHYQEPWTDMLSDAVIHVQAAERLQQRFFQLSHPGPQPSWEPPVDIYTDRNRISVLIALPGVSEDQCELSLENGCITVNSERTYLDGGVCEAILRLEIPYGRFQRRIPLPSGHYDLLQKVMKNGCLHLSLEKSLEKSLEQAA
jgi:HSP20 family molecular chaperone IbpA